MEQHARVLRDPQEQDTQAGTPSRAAAALAALRRAEEHTGARPARISDLGAQRGERPPLAVPQQLAGLLPAGLRRGSVLEVTGSAALMLEILAAASEQEDEGLWIGLVGQPLIGVLAAAEAGVDLRRLILVPRPGPDAALALAALLDGVDILVVGPEAGLLPSDRRRLMTRARERGVVLVATAPWDGAHVALAVTGVRWRGLGAGSGRLLSRELSVTRDGRAGAAQSARVEITLPTGAAPTVPSTPAGATLGQTRSEPAHPEVEAPESDTPMTPAQRESPLRLVG